MGRFKWGIHEMACMRRCKMSCGDGGRGGDVPGGIQESSEPSHATRIAFVRSDAYNELACTLQHLGESFR